MTRATNSQRRITKVTEYSEAKEAGYDDNQIWSVTVHDDWFCYGPPHHYVNHVGHIATKERHDNDTYYEEEGWS
jgi:hypothetical protein